MTTFVLIRFILYLLRFRDRGRLRKLINWFLNISNIHSILTAVSLFLVHQLHLLGVVGPVLDDVEDQLGPWLLHCPHLLVLFLCDTCGTENSSEQHD